MAVSVTVFIVGLVGALVLGFTECCLLNIALTNHVVAFGALMILGILGMSATLVASMLYEAFFW